MVWCGCSGIYVVRPGVARSFYGEGGGCGEGSVLGYMRVRFWLGIAMDGRVVYRQFLCCEAQQTAFRILEDELLSGTLHIVGGKDEKFRRELRSGRC